ncbi:hypothetical protein [Bradyrhizobium sp.]|uniref:hypothetical protein n=1 Tax=Bradyrhizobium sp. TaxID=376 RepID=UPI001ED55C8C|nr:hypothetical protein [Bradyrhizobium sp.]MBV9980577.1 hypothetical protein [Bradyrhizobium sp.]
MSCEKSSCSEANRSQIDADISVMPSAHLDATTALFQGYCRSRRLGKDGRVFRAPAKQEQARGDAEVAAMRHRSEEEKFITSWEETLMNRRQLVTAAVAMPFIVQGQGACAAEHTLKLVYPDTPSHPFMQVARRFAAGEIPL